RVPGDQLPDRGRGFARARKMKFELGRTQARAGRHTVSHRRVGGWDVHEACQRTEAHRVPGMSAVGVRSNFYRTVRVQVEARGWVLYWPSRLEIDVRSPGDRNELVGRQQFAGLPIQHREEAVLRRMHEHLTISTPDREVRQHDLRSRAVIPSVPRSFLIVPAVTTRVGLDRND